MPGGERATLLVVGEILNEPLILRRAGLERLVRHVVVQDDHVPVAEVERVVALVAGAGAITEVIERTISVARVVLMIPERGPGACLVTAPGGLVALVIVL